MQSAFCKCTDVGAIIRLLPSDQIMHMSNVGWLVGTMANLIAKDNMFEADISICRHFGSAALFHDIGKVCVPHWLLVKPGKLTAEEYRWIKEHTIYACSLFKKIKDGAITGIPQNLIDLAYDSAVYHHEWWDGNGYPYGISYEDIPFIARVTSVCDAYDAMTGSRTYHTARSHEYACSEIERNSGTQFDPELVKIFLDNESKFNKHIYSEVAISE